MSSAITGAIADVLTDWIEKGFHHLTPTAQAVVIGTVVVVGLGILAGGARG